MHIVATIPAVGVLAGAWLGLVIPAGSRPLLWLILAGCATAAVYAAAAARGCLVGVMAALAFAAGCALLAADEWEVAWRPTFRTVFEEFAAFERRAALSEGRPVPEDDEAVVVVAGILRSDAVHTGTGVSLSVDVESMRSLSGAGGGDRTVSGGLLATVGGSLGVSNVDRWRAGRRIRAPVQLRRPARYLDPGVPDGERALARSGTSLVGTIKSPALIELMAPGGWWSESTGQVRDFARRAIARVVGPRSTRAAAIVTAIVIGDRAGLDDELRRRLQEAGTYHVIAISGGNIAILAGAFIAVCRFAGYLGPAAMLATITLLVAYAGVVNGGASVQRATWMAVVYFLSRAADHRSPPLNILAVVAAGLVILDPLAVTDPGFALTFGATLGILLSQLTKPRAEAGTVPTAWSALRTAVRGVFVATVAAELLLFPVGAIVFSRITLAGLVLNFAAIPLMGVAQMAGMFVVVFDAVAPALAAAAGFVAYLSAEGLVWSASLVRFVPQVTWRVAAPSLGVVATYYVGAGVAWALWRRRDLRTGSRERRSVARVRWAAVVCSGLAGLWILTQPATLVGSNGDGRLRLTFLDVGQGDSTLIRFPGGSSMLVDAGGLAGASGFDVGDRVVAPVLRTLALRRLDYLLITHGDPDHVGGAASIAREFHPRALLEGIAVARSLALTTLRQEAEASGARHVTVYRGWRTSVDGVEVVAAHPPPPDWERREVRNDDSVVIDVRWRSVSILLTGDIGRDVEGELARQLTPAPLTVLKVPHHGSRTSSSSALLEALRPQVAIVSAGRANHFGHPAPDVLDRYRAVNASVLRTDRDGAIAVETDGHSMQVRTFTGRAIELLATRQIVSAQP